jgi:Glycosyltransferase family 87
MNKSNQKPIKTTLWILAGLSVFLFALFAWPNLAASKNLAMVQAFEPDEAVLIPYVLHMISPASSIFQFLHQFIFYDYYFYGFPFFAFSALVLLPLQWLGQLTNMPLVMLILRQSLSVLPLMAAILILLYMQDGFRTYRSPVLFVFFMSVPGVIQNNFWWHPDGLTVLLVVLTIFFLRRDNLRFGWNFIIAAIATGLAAAIKLVGFYFFLAIALTLILGIVLKRASWQRILCMALAFLGIMTFSYLAANPFLVSHWARDAYFQIFIKQTSLLSEGYGIVYSTGLAATLPAFSQFYGGAVILLIAIGTAIWGVIKGPEKLLQALILAWCLPLTVMVFFLTHFKFQYWLPVALPLFSCLILILPEKVRGYSPLSRTNLLRSLLILVLLAQFVIFLQADAPAFWGRVNREATNPRITFYDRVLNSLNPAADPHLNVYYDYRLYVPGQPGWNLSTSYDLLNYDYIQRNKFDVLILLEQRIKDYLNPSAVGIDSQQFARAQAFYRDAQNGTISGYHLVFRDDIGLVLVSDAIFNQYFQK